MTTDSSTGDWTPERAALVRTLYEKAIPAWQGGAFGMMASVAVTHLPAALAEIERLTAELATRSPAARVTGVRVATGAREELNEFAEQAWRDGTTVEAFTDIREEPADASLEARAEALRATWWRTKWIDAPLPEWAACVASEKRAWIAVVRALDAGCPSAPFAPTQEQANRSALLLALFHKGATERQVIDFLDRENEERLAQLIKLKEREWPAGVVMPAGRPTLTEEQAREVLDLLDDAIAEQEDGDGTETSNGNARLRIATFRGIKAAILRASRSKDGPASAKEMPSVKPCPAFFGLAGSVYGAQPGDRCDACKRTRAEHGASQ